MVLLIMAAGSGSRYGKLKQFDDLGPNKEFLLEFSIYDAIENFIGSKTTADFDGNRTYVGFLFDASYDNFRYFVPFAALIDKSMAS